MSISKVKSIESLNYCIKLIRERDYENYFSTLLMPKEVRARIFSILALNVEISIIRHKIKRNSGVTGINQLKFWRDALETLGERKGPLPRQPVMLALSAFDWREDLPLLQSLVESRQQTLGDRPFVDVQNLEHNSILLYGSLIQLQMNALKYFYLESKRQILDNPEGVIKSLACAIGITTVVRSTLPLLRDQVLLLPTDLQKKHGVYGKAFKDSSSLVVLQPVTKDLCEIAKRHLDASRQPMATVNKELRPALMVPVLRSEYILKILQKNKYNLLDGRLNKPHPFGIVILWLRNFRNVY